MRGKDGIRNNAAWMAGLAAGMLVLIFTAGLHREEEELQREIASKVVRFHVEANSDRKQDQEDKLAVRDALLGEMERLLDDCSDREPGKEMTEQVLRASLPELEQCAENVLRERGCSLPVEVSFGDSWFPQKTYGSYTFPPGEYEALKVTIGEGEGHNWWCMLYPSLCFPDAMHAVPDAEGERELKSVLSDEAYDSILRRGELRFSFFLAIFQHSG